jgi:hypothetical protein
MISEHLHAVTELARDLKATAARRAESDLSAQIAVYRGLDPVAIVITGKHQRDLILDAAHIAARGFGPDAIALLIETWCAHVDHAEANPVTGEPWGPGEMQDAVENHRAREKGWVSDALLIEVHNRAGDVAAASLPYRIVRREVVWGEPLTTPDRMEGVVPDALTEIMAEPDLVATAYLENPDWDLSPEELRDICDVTAARALVERGNAVLLWAEPGSDRERLIKERLGQSVRPMPRQRGRG